MARPGRAGRRRDSGPRFHRAERRQGDHRRPGATGGALRWQRAAGGWPGGAGGRRAHRPLPPRRRRPAGAASPWLGGCRRRTAWRRADRREVGGSACHPSPRKWQWRHRCRPRHRAGGLSARDTHLGPRWHEALPPWRAGRIEHRHRIGVESRRHPRPADRWGRLGGGPELSRRRGRAARRRRCARRGDAQADRGGDPRPLARGARRCPGILWRRDLRFPHRVDQPVCPLRRRSGCLARRRRAATPRQPPRRTDKPATEARGGDSPRRGRSGWRRAWHAARGLSGCGGVHPRKSCQPGPGRGARVSAGPRRRPAAADRRGEWPA